MTTALGFRFANLKGNDLTGLNREKGGRRRREKRSSNSLIEARNPRATAGKRLRAVSGVLELNGV